MAKLSDMALSEPLKGLILGDSGSGKTGALASLAKEYELFILDFDNGTDILLSALKGNSAALNNVKVETLIDKRGSTAGAKSLGLSSSAHAFRDCIRLLDDWTDREDGTKYGKPSSWGRDKILVIDSLTFLAKSAMDHVLSINGRAGLQPFQSDWGDAMRLVEDVLATLYSDHIKCNVLVLAHIEYAQAEGTGILRGIPVSLGNKLSPKIGRYFNTMLLVKQKGKEKIILTQADSLIPLKCPILTAPAELPQATGLATLFSMWKALSPSPASKDAQPKEN